MEEKEKMKNRYIEEQNNVREQLQKEEKENIERRLHKVIMDKSQKSFWKESKKAIRNDESTWIVTKNSEGKSLFDPKENL